MRKKKRRQVQVEVADDLIQHLCVQAIAKATEALKSGRFTEAEDLMEQVRRVSAATNDSNHILALALHRQGKNLEAREIAERLVKENPKNWEYWNTLGVINSMLRQSQLAMLCFNHALKVTNDDNGTVVASSNLGLEYQSEGRYMDAQFAFRDAFNYATESQKPMLYFNIGNLMMERQNPEAAENCFEKALEALPDFTPAAWNLASALLCQGAYGAGWKAYESRWRQFPAFAERKRQYQCEELTKVDHSIKDKRILLYCEQGAGDAIQFIRFAKRLKELGAVIIVEWDNQFIRGDLTSLLRRVEWIDQVVSSQEAATIQYDFHQSMCSLPYLLNAFGQANLRCEKYLQPDAEFAPELADHFWKRYSGQFKVGLVWAGNPSHHNDPKRSCAFDAMYEAFKNLDAALFSLQRDNRPRHWPGLGVVDLSAGLAQSDVVDLATMMTDYNSTANLISQLDLIVTVDTVVAHLAGAMGKQTFLLLPRTPDWRWGMHGERTHWYDSVRIFRQKQRGNWHLPLSEAANEAKILGRSSRLTADA